MKEKDLDRINPCGDGEMIDEYLGGTMCEFQPEIEDVTVPENHDFIVHEPEEPETDDRYAEFM